MYLYILEIVPEEREILITVSKTTLWNLIPFNHEAFKELLKIYPDYKIYELDEKFLRERADRHSYLNPN
jgi:hypothetical protein